MNLTKIQKLQAWLAKLCCFDIFLGKKTSAFVCFFCKIHNFQLKIIICAFCYKVLFVVSQYVLFDCTKGKTNLAKMHWCRRFVLTFIYRIFALIHAHSELLSCFLCARWESDKKLTVLQIFLISALVLLSRSFLDVTTFTRRNKKVYFPIFHHFSDSVLQVWTRCVSAVEAQLWLIDEFSHLESIEGCQCVCGMTSIRRLTKEGKGFQWMG